MQRVAIWRDDAAVGVEPDQPVVTAFDQGLGRGDGVFESVLVTGGRTPHLDAHLARLPRSAQLTDLTHPGEDEVVLDVPGGREDQRLRPAAVGQPLEVLAGQAVQPAQAVGPRHDEDVPVAAVDQPGALGQPALLGQRVAVVRGDAVVGRIAQDRRAGDVGQRHRAAAVHAAQRP